MPKETKQHSYVEDIASMLTLESLNRLEREAFTAALAFVFEGPPWIPAATWPARPFADLMQLHQALCAVIQHAPVEQQVVLIQAHPDLAGRAAIAGELTPESTHEQASAGLDQLTPSEYVAFTRLNEAYRATFGFPFVICVRGQTKQAILDSFEIRLQHSRDQEIATALGEIAKIAWLRLNDRVV
jgi:OHCU decarboxylase